MTPARPTASSRLPSLILASVTTLLLASCTSATGPEIAAPSVNLSNTASIQAVEVPETEAFAEPAAAAASTEQAVEAADREAGDEKAEPATAAAAKSGEPVEGKEEVASAASVAPAPVTPGPSQMVDGNKRAFLSSFFGNSDVTPPSTAPSKPLLVQQVDAGIRAPGSGPVDSGPPKVVPKPVVQLASAEKPLIASAKTEWEWGDGNPLPGVRQNALFEIKRKSGLDDDSDIDLNEGGGDEGSFSLASAAGMARLAPNGLLKQRESVDTACLKPALVSMLKKAESHFGKKLMVTSGFRSRTYNRKVNGARNSMHMYCAAADIQMAGVGKWELAQFFRSMPGRGGVGTYCQTTSVHVDVGPERDWNWRCRGKG